MSTRDRSFWIRYREVRKNDCKALESSGEFDSKNPEHRYLKKFNPTPTSKPYKRYKRY